MAITVFQEDIDRTEVAISRLSGPFADVRKDIAEAIAAQRELSAQIAEAFALRGHGDIAKQIAAQIRKNQFS